MIDYLAMARSICVDPIAEVRRETTDCAGDYRIEGEAPPREPAPRDPVVQAVVDRLHSITNPRTSAKE